MIKYTISAGKCMTSQSQINCSSEALGLHTNTGWGGREGGQRGERLSPFQEKNKCHQLRNHWKGESFIIFNKSQTTHCYFCGGWHCFK